MKEKLSNIFDTIRDQSRSLVQKPPSASEIRFAFKSFNFYQKIFFTLFLLIFLGSLTGLIWLTNERFMVTVKKPGGSFTEGILGSPRFINPLLAISDADRDLVPLVYSGLMRLLPNGEFIPDLAENYSTSSDNLIYTFKLKPNLYWQDSEEVVADDVIFTIQTAQDRNIRSVKRANWEGVTVKKLDEKTVQFILKKPYAAFLSNTTMGLIPKHLWQNLSAETFSLSNLNTEPIGTGPYKIKNVKKNSNDIPIAYNFEPFANFTLGKPSIENLTINFYANQQELAGAYLNGEIDSLALINPQLNGGLANVRAQAVKVPLPRLFGVFFNQSKAQIFTLPEVREALNLATDREGIIREALGGAGEALDQLFPPGTLGYEKAKKTQADIAAAKKILEDKDWNLNQEGVMEKKEYKTKTSKDKKGKTVTEKVETGNSQTLSFTLATVNLPELKKVAEKIKSDWAKIGAKVEIKIYEAADLNQNIIRPRRYEALLFGEIIGRDSDPFPFWHSSQRLDPGLNIALYTNSKADKIMEETRALADQSARKEKYELLKQEVTKDIPAIFLYSPYFIYYLPTKTKGVDDISFLSVPSDRFLSIYNWYEKTDRIWRFFANPKSIVKN